MYVILLHILYRSDRPSYPATLSPPPLRVQSNTAVKPPPAVNNGMLCVSARAHACAAAVGSMYVFHPVAKTAWASCSQRSQQHGCLHTFTANCCHSFRPCQYYYNKTRSRLQETSAKMISEYNIGGICIFKLVFCLSEGLSLKSNEIFVQCLNKHCLLPKKPQRRTTEQVKLRKRTLQADWVYCHNQIGCNVLNFGGGQTFTINQQKITICYYLEMNIKIDLQFNTSKYVI